MPKEKKGLPSILTLGNEQTHVQEYTRTGKLTTSHGSPSSGINPSQVVSLSLQLKYTSYILVPHFSWGAVAWAIPRIHLFATSLKTRFYLALVSSG